VEREMREVEKTRGGYALTWLKSRKLSLAPLDILFGLEVRLW
jgi:hypothetical protein